MSQSSPPPDRFKACEVTGEILPVDSLVQFQGKWVSEKGKQILLERLQSGEPAETSYTPRPGFWRRYGCIFLDGLVLIIPNAVVIFSFGTVGLAQNTKHPSVFGTPFIHGMRDAGIGQILIFLIGTAYFGIAQGKWGQTLGKRVGREKVVRMDGSPVDMKTGILRGAYYVMPSLISAIGALSAMLPLLYVCYVLGVLWSLADVICLIADRRMQRALHDRLAGTRVILLPEP